MERKREIVEIHTPEITLGQLLKFADVISEGGEAKLFLATHQVLVNGDKEERRGKKLHPGDEITLPDCVLLLKERIDE